MTGLRSRNRKKLTLFLISGPILGLAFSFILYAVINLITSSSDSDLEVFNTVANIFLFLLGVISLLALVPCMIVGLIMLNHHNKTSTNKRGEDIQNNSRDWGNIE